jgi:hypothetical protein
LSHRDALTTQQLQVQNLKKHLQEAHALKAYPMMNGTQLQQLLQAQSLGVAHEKAYNLHQTR